jgi:hypothetical protein
MLASACVTDFRDWRSAGSAQVLLAQQRLFLSLASEILPPAAHAPSPYPNPFLNGLAG